MPKLPKTLKRRSCAVILCVIAATAGVWIYRHWQKTEGTETAIVQLNCSYALAIGENYSELVACIKAGEGKAETYSRIGDQGQRLEFLTDVCLSGSKFSLTTSECKDYAWKILYRD